MAIIDALVKAPANALTKAAAIGWVEPSTAPNNPAITAKANKRGINLYISHFVEGFFLKKTAFQI